MKHPLLKQICTIFLSSSIILGSAAPALCADAYIRKPAKKSANAAEYYQGNVTYYSTDSQKWINVKSTLFYIYKGKKNTRYYKPLYYLTASWMSNNRQNITVHLGQSKSKSVSKIIQSSLGISSPNTSLATSISSNYSSTVSTSYTTDYTFVMKNYSTLYYYRPAFFGNILKYGIIKTNRFTRRSSVMYSYTFDRESGLYLKLARK